MGNSEYIIKNISSVSHISPMSNIVLTLKIYTKNVALFSVCTISIKWPIYITYILYLPIYYIHKFPSLSYTLYPSYDFGLIFWTQNIDYLKNIHNTHWLSQSMCLYKVSLITHLSPIHCNKVTWSQFYILHIDFKF